MQTNPHTLNIDIRKSGSQLSLCIVLWSVTPPAQDRLELNPDIRPVKHPTGVERAGGGSEGREVLFDWMD